MGGDGPRKEEWDSLRKWLGDGFPFGGEANDFRWVTEYVDGVVKEALSAGDRKDGRPVPPAGKPLAYELFQTHRHVIVRFAVPERMRPRRLRVYAGVQRLRIDGLPNGASQTITLPALVHTDTARALYRDGVLQIKLMKRRVNDRFEEVYVRFE